MSIAVSTVVRPSRIFRGIIGVMAANSALIGFAIAFGMVGDLSLPVRFAIAPLVIFLSVFGFYHDMSARKTIQLDISGTGQIRLLKMANEPPCADVNRPHVKETGEVVCLMKDATIWPTLLLLRLQSENGEVTVVSIFPDSVSRDDFRALSVAFRWIATQAETQDEKIF